MAETIYRGLDGVVVDTTAVSQVTSETSSLVYRGYPVQELAEKCTFEEVVYLLWNGELPSRQQLDEFSQRERSQRSLDERVLKSIALFPTDAHPMDMLRSGVSVLGMLHPRMDQIEVEGIDALAMELLAKTPTITAACYRHRKGQPPIAPREDLSFSENFFHMTFGEVPAAEVVKAFDVSMILYAEHSFNASTFTARVVTSTLADVYSAVVAAIGALKGPLHGGANEQVMHMLKEIGEPSKARQFVLDALAQKRKLMGFGHRVYKQGDSRAPTMQKYGLKMAEVKNERRWHEIAAEVEKVMIETKNIYPNLDFPTGPAYYLMGFDIDFFTPFFAMARIAGWSAHIKEQAQNNRLIRPLSKYTGPAERRVQAR
jgi:2-methylcitrate synthase